MANKLEVPYNLLIKRIRKAKVVYVDETELKVDGMTYYIWTFVTEQEVLFVIRKSRAKKVIEEILGYRFKGVICCDGWKAYSQYSDKLQRCWAHLLRESKNLAEKYTEFEGFYASFKKLFEKIGKIRARPPPLKKREKLKEDMEKEVEQIVGQMNAYQEFRKFATKVGNGLNYWFTCIIDLFVEPTNNNAERALRELVAQRKIIGTLRNNKGTTIMERIHTCIATWKQKGLNPFTELKAQLC